MENANRLYAQRIQSSSKRVKPTKAVSGNVQPARFQYMTIAGKANGVNWLEKRMERYGKKSLYGSTNAKTINHGLR